MTGEGFFDQMDRIDAVIAAGPLKSDIARDVMPYLADEQVRAYFYDTISDADPAWLPALHDQQAFDGPPQAIMDAAAETIVFPFWPEGRYLAAMARRSPDLVFEIVWNLPDGDNPRVHDSLTEIATALPPRLAARFVARASTWLNNPYRLLLADHLRQLLVHLANGGEVPAAIDLARAVLMPGPASREGNINDREPRSALEMYEYEAMLQSYASSVIPNGDIAALDALCDALESAVRSRADVDPARGDHSYHWRPTIEDSEQNRFYESEFENLLVSAVRDGARALIERDVITIENLVERLEARAWPIFRRLALALLLVFGDAAAGFIADRLADREAAGSIDLWHEYSLLLRDRYYALSDRDRQRVLAVIEMGPPQHSSVDASGESKNTAEQWRRIWQANRLELIKEHLPPSAAERYSRLIGEIGPIERPEFLSYVTPVIGPDLGTAITLSEEELTKTSLPTIVARLRDWTPQDDPLGQAISSQAQALAAIIPTRVSTYARGARLFRGLDPAYVRAVLMGLRSAFTQTIRPANSLPWLPVLELCEWSVQQVGHIERHSIIGESTADPDWTWTRTEIARLLSIGFNDRPLQLPLRWRRRAWKLLEILIRDPDPTVEYEREHLGDGDPNSLAMNTVRGEAMHAVVGYAAWVLRHHMRQEGAEEPSGFDTIPEVRRVLDQHLDPVFEPSLAIRSVYGRQLPTLASLDLTWTAQNIARIFPHDAVSRSLRDAAWGAYIRFAAPSSKTVDLLTDEYTRAVANLDDVTDIAARPGSTAHRLVEHLVVLYWRGQFALDVGPFAQFWTQASPELRAHALTYIGRSLKGTKDDVPPEILRHLRNLWLWRLEVARTATDRLRRSEELAAFGWWFASARFDDEWAIAQLEEELTVAGAVDPAFLVIERLAEIAPTFPGQATKCLSLMVENADDANRYWLSEGPIRRILKEAVSVEDLGVKREAERLIDVLGRVGFRALRDLRPLTR